MFKVLLSFLIKISYVYGKSSAMKKIVKIGLFLFFITINAFAQTGAKVYLLTCGPGTETYSVYGHSALRVIIPEKNFDMIYNWGVFDFSTPNFAWKFAKGRLEYMLIVESVQRFLGVYNYERRFVLLQEINLEPGETEILLSLIAENIKPENAKYRYDFFYDDCSTRIRDLIEKSVGEKLLYPPSELEEEPTFREMVGRYQRPYQWLNFGIDLIMGSPGDKETNFRDRMFLPIDLKDGLSSAVISRDGRMVPLMQNPQIILDFGPQVLKTRLITSPVVVFILLMVLIFILTVFIKNRRIIKAIDLLLFFVYSILAILMIFFNFFTDHMQMRWNLNIIWLNPFILICLAALIINKEGTLWFRIVFYISAAFLLLHLFLPQEFNIAFIPLVVILMFRSSVRAGFGWNPLTLTNF